MFCVLKKVFPIAQSVVKYFLVFSVKIIIKKIKFIFSIDT